MIRYIRLYYYFVKFSILSKLEYRFDFIANTLRSIGWLFVSIFGFTVIFSQTKSIAGWSKNEALVLYGVYVCINELFYTLFFLNLVEIPRMVQYGELDFILLRPISSQFLLSLKNFMIYSVPNFLFSLFVIFHYSSLLEKHISIFEYGLGALLIMNGLLILYSIMFIVVCCSVWMVQFHSFWEIFEMATEGARYPVDTYKGLLHFLFLTIIPLAFIFTFPAQFIAKQLPVYLVIISFGIGAIALFLSHHMFKFAIRHYNSASS